MEIEVILIRSGMTASNKAQRYLGKDDEPLCEEGIEQLKSNIYAGKYGEVQRIYTASSERCRQTAAIIYPNSPAIVAEGFVAFDYGAFAGKTYSELRHEPEFASWASGINENFLEAEDSNIIIYKNIMAFRAIMKECENLPKQRIAIITHRSAIVSVIRRMCLPRSIYQNVGIAPGEGVCLLYDSYSNMVSYAPAFAKELKKESKKRY